MGHEGYCRGGEEAGWRYRTGLPLERGQKEIGYLKHCRRMNSFSAVRLFENILKSYNHSNKKNI